MRWTPKCAHLLLQVRTKVLSDEFGGCLSQLVPGVRRSSPCGGDEDLVG